MSDRETQLLAGVQSGLYINGAWVPAESGATFDVHDPATNNVIASIADATPADGLRALDACRELGVESHLIFSNWHQISFIK